MINNIVGAATRGKDFFGREKLIDLIWEKLNITNVSLVSPRRFGKTSVMYNLLDNPKPDYKLIHLDLEAVKEPVEFVIKMLDEIRKSKIFHNLIKKGRERLSELLRDFQLKVDAGEGIEFQIGLKEKLRKSWQEIGEEILAELENSDKKLIIIFDEFSIMVENFLDGRLEENEVREFLNWFRKIRISPNLTKCRFLIGSSISIDHRLTGLNCIAAFNDFEKITLGELENERTALLLIDKLLEGKQIKISKIARKKILELIGPPIPYFIQILISEIGSKSGRYGKNVTPKIINSIYNEIVLGSVCKSYFQHYYDRIKYYSPLIERAARIILRRLALEGNVKKEVLYQLFLEAYKEKDSVDAFNNLMSDLENDFYIKYDYENNNYSFCSKILMDWWKRYYSL